MRPAALFRFFAAGVFVAGTSCIWDPAETTYVLSLQVPDSLTQMDTVSVIVLTPARETVEVAWNRPLPHVDSLARLRPTNYRGEDAIVQVSAFRNGFRAYKIEAWMHGDGRPTEFTRYLFPTKDAPVETTMINNNYGLHPTGGLKPMDSGWAFALQFDWSGVPRERIASAHIRLLSFAYPLPWTEEEVKLEIHVNALRSEWQEGRGNYFWHGGWQNNGQDYLAHYPFSLAVKSVSMEIYPATGINGTEKVLFRRQNLEPVATQTVALRFVTSAGHTRVPKPAELVPIEIDVTEYIRKTESRTAFGFALNAEGFPAGDAFVGFATKELGNQIYGPELIIRY